MSKPTQHTVSDARLTWPAPLLDLASAIISQRLVFAGLIILFLAFGIIRLILLPAIYTSSAVAVLLPREKPLLDAAIDTSSIETSDDSAGRSSAGNLMLPPNPTLYTTLILSRPVLSEIAREFGERLDGHVSPRDRSDEVIQRIRSMITVTSTEEGLITINVDSKDADLSADIANALFAECERSSKSIERQLILTQAIHLEEALEHSRKRLRVTEQELASFTARFGVIDVGMQAGNQLRSIRELAAEKDRLETDLAELLLSHSDRSPEVIRLRSRITAIEKQRTGNGTSIVGSIGTEDFGRLLVDHESLQQKIRFERDLVATLATKADLYRLRAEEPTGNLAVIRPAMPPSRPSGPSKKRELGIMLVIAIMLGTGWALFIRQWNVVSMDAHYGAHIAELLEQLKSLPAFPFAWNKVNRKKVCP